MLDSARRSENKGRIAHALHMTSVAATSMGDGIRGAILAGEAREAAGDAGSPTAQAHANYALGLALESVDPADALAHLELASKYAATAHNRWVEAFSLTEVHWLQSKRGERLSALLSQQGLGGDDPSRKSRAGECCRNRSEQRSIVVGQLRPFGLAPQDGSGPSRAVVVKADRTRAARTVVVATGDGAGNVHPIAAVVCALAARGDDVHVLGHEPIRAPITITRCNSWFQQFAMASRAEQIC